MRNGFPETPTAALPQRRDHHDRHQHDGPDELEITHLRRRELDDTAPSSGDAYIWDGNLWVPTSVATELDDLSDVDTSGASDGDALVLDSGTWVPGSGGFSAFAGSDTAVDVVSSTAEIEVVSFSVPADTFAAGDALMVEAHGDLLKNTTGALTVRFYLGSTAMFATVWVNSSHPDFANRRRWLLRGRVFVRSTSAQSASLVAESTLSSASADATLPLEIMSGIAVGHRIGTRDDVAEDLTANRDVELTAQWDTSSSSLSFRLFGYRAHILRA